MKQYQNQYVVKVLGSLSKDVFERRTSTGSEVFSLTICLEAKKFVLISFFSLIRTIYLRVSTKPPPNDAKRPLPVDVRRSKMLLLKLPIKSWLTLTMLRPATAPRREKIIFLLSYKKMCFLLVFSIFLMTSKPFLLPRHKRCYTNKYINKYFFLYLQKG